MESHKLELLDKKDCLVICPTRIRPEQAKAMYNTFKKTSTYNSEVIFYIAEDDPRIDDYKIELRNCAYIIDKRRTIIQVMNHISCVLYPKFKYYSCIGDDNRYSTRGWDTEFVKEIEIQGRGWGFAYGNDLLQKEKLCGNPIISGDIIRVLGYMALPILQHQFVDNFWTDLGIALNRIYYRDDIIQEHLHPFAKKGKMDANYEWIYHSGVTEKDQAAYSMWRRKEFTSVVRQVARAMLADYRQKGEYKSISLCMIVADTEKPEILRRCLNSAVDYVDEVNIVFNYKHFKSWGIKKLFAVADEFKANFCYTKWINFSAMRNMSLGMATKDYIFWTDTDDVLEFPNGILIHDCIYHRPEADCLKCQVLSDTPSGGQELILQNRLFKNKKEFDFRNDIHEDISYSMLEQNAQIVLTDITIRHLGNRDLKHFRGKNKRNYKMLTREIKSGKAHQLTYFHLINTLMIFGKEKYLKQAIKYVDYTLEHFGLKPQDPIVAKLRTLRGLCCMKLYDKTKDVRLREAARVDFTTSYAQKKGPEAAVNIAEILMQENNWDDTIKLLEDNLQDEQKPQNMPFDYKNIYLLMLFKLGDCYCRKQDWAKAENYFKQFMGINSDNLEVADRLAQVLRNMNKWDEAELLTVKAVNRWPSYFVGWSNLGQFEIANKRYITAQVFLQQALRIKPDFQEALVNLRTIQKIWSNFSEKGYRRL